jgi:carbohydrate-selective porin OprB
VSVEQGVELSYKMAIRPWRHITPDLQFLTHPGSGDRGVALVYGLRTEVSL